MWPELSVSLASRKASLEEAFCGHPLPPHHHHPPPGTGSGFSPAGDGCVRCWGRTLGSVGGCWSCSRRGHADANGAGIRLLVAAARPAHLGTWADVSSSRPVPGERVSRARRCSSLEEDEAPEARRSSRSPASFPSPAVPGLAAPVGPACPTAALWPTVSRRAPSRVLLRQQDGDWLLGAGAWHGVALGEMVASFSGPGSSRDSGPISQGWAVGQ